MLDAYDSPATREIIKAAITSILAELCGNVEDVSASLKEYIEGNLTPNLDKVGAVISRGFMISLFPGSGSVSENAKWLKIRLRIRIQAYNHKSSVNLLFTGSEFRS